MILDLRTMPLLQVKKLSCVGAILCWSEVFLMNLERSFFQDSVRELGQVSGSFGSGS